MTGHFLLWKSTVGLRKMTRNFYSCEKFRRTRKELTNESENDRSLFIVKKYRRTRKELIMSPRMTGHFVKSTVGLRRKTRNFYNGEKFRRTRKELTNESENDRSLFIVKSTVRLAKNL